MRESERLFAVLWYSRLAGTPWLHLVQDVVDRRAMEDDLTLTAGQRLVTLERLRRHWTLTQAWEAMPAMDPPSPDFRPRARRPRV